jgi:hypothetical protein
MDPIASPFEGSVTHVVYDPQTGRILGTMRHAPQDVRPGEQPEPTCRCGDDHTLLAGFAEEAETVPRLVDATPDVTGRLADLRVDPASRQLVALPTSWWMRRARP